MSGAVNWSVKFKSISAAILLASLAPHAMAFVISNSAHATSNTAASPTVLAPASASAPSPAPVPSPVIAQATSVAVVSALPPPSVPLASPLPATMPGPVPTAASPSPSPQLSPVAALSPSPTPAASASPPAGGASPGPVASPKPRAGAIDFNPVALIRSVAAILDLFRPNKTASSFCYSLENDNTVQGINVDEPVRIASVMKVITSFWAVYTFGPNYRFTTKIYYSPSQESLHIEGSRDPFFDRDRLLYLLSNLNQHGIKHLKQVTSDSNFYFNVNLFEFLYDDSYSGQASYKHNELHTKWLHDRESQLSDLHTYFNTADWWTSRRDRYARFATNERGNVEFANEIEFSSEAIDVVDQNPIAGAPDLQVLEVVSRPIRHYLKFMNMLSLNPVADEVFQSMGGAPSLQKFMSTQLSMNREFKDVYAGSGLDIKSGSSRFDTKVSCATVVRLLKKMDLDLRKSYKMSLSNLMMISGVDEGTWGSPTKALVVKTGTLTSPGYTARNLAGRADTANGQVYFGVFMQTNRSATAGIQSIVADLFSAMGGPKAIEAQPFEFEPLDDRMSLRNYNLGDELYSNALQPKPAILHRLR